MGAVSGATPAHQLFMLEGTTATMVLIGLLTKCLPVSVQPGGRSAAETLGTVLQLCLAPLLLITPRGGTVIASLMGPSPPEWGELGWGGFCSSLRFAERSEGGSIPVPGGDGSVVLGLGHICCPHCHLPSWWPPRNPGLWWQSRERLLCLPPSWDGGPPCNLPLAARAAPPALLPSVSLQPAPRRRVNCVPTLLETKG